MGKGRAGRQRSSPREVLPFGPDAQDVTLSFVTKPMGGTEQISTITINNNRDFERWVASDAGVCLWVYKNGTHKRVKQVANLADAIRAHEAGQQEQTYLRLEHPNDDLSGRMKNMESFRDNMASGLEQETTRAVANDMAFRVQLETPGLKIVNGGHPVIFYKKNVRGTSRVEVLEVDGMALDVKAKKLVLNEAKLSPSLKDIGTIETKITSLTGWLTLASRDPARFETKPAAVKDELISVGCSEWEILPVLSGNNFSVEMQEQCEDHELSVMKSNGSSYSWPPPASTPPTAEHSPLSASTSARRSISPSSELPSSPPQPGAP
jgi:hypothetical protein